MSSDHGLSRLIRHQAKDGETVYYRVTAGYIAVILTVIMLLLVKQYGWLW